MQLKGVETIVMCYVGIETSGEIDDLHRVFWALLRPAELKHVRSEA